MIILIILIALQCYGIPVFETILIVGIGIVLLSLGYGMLYIINAIIYTIAKKTSKKLSTIIYWIVLRI